MPRVLHLITSLEVGGAQEMLRKLLAALDAERHSAQVVSLRSGGRLAGEIAAGGVPVRELGMRPDRPSASALPRLVRLLRRERPDVLQCWLYHADLLGVVAAAFAGVRRVVWNLRAARLDERHASATRDLVVRACAGLSRLPAAVVVNSRAGEVFHGELGYRPRRWVRIPNGFDLGALRFDPRARRELRSELELGEGELVALCAARFDPSKGHLDLVDAIARREGPPITWLLAGAGVDSSNRELGEALARARRPGADGGARVRLLGERRDVPRLLSAADLLVSPSRFEAFPNVLGEAMAAERPCVATDAGDSAEVLGGTGLVVPAGDPPALAAAIDRMARLGAEDRRALGRSARERVEREYAIERIAERYGALYEELAGGRSRARRGSSAPPA